MPQLHGAVIASRAGALREKGAAALERHLQGARGRRITVLMENEEAGRAADFTPVRLKTEAGAGRLIDAVVAGDDGTALIAVPS
jgi:threonylcarbamoyladenosine tRNA methylthiotransferase MtaB